MLLILNTPACGCGFSRGSGKIDRGGSVFMSVEMSADSFPNGELNIIGPEYYQQNGYPHREWTFLRQHQPVYRYEGSCAEPFWAITKHADIVQVAKQPLLFTNRPR